MVQDMEYVKKKQSLAGRALAIKAYALNGSRLSIAENMRLNPKSERKLAYECITLHKISYRTLDITGFSGFLVISL
jgi:hypothetical protein